MELELDLESISLLTISYAPNFAHRFTCTHSCYGFPDPVEPGVEPVADDLLLRWTGRKLVVEATRLGSGDNCSAVIVSLKDLK